MNKNYINNLETGKIELHFTKEEYSNLSEDLKRELKSSYLFSGKAKAWVSRSKNNHYSAIRTAEKLGFTSEKVTGTKLSFKEELERQVEKAESRIEKYEQYSENAIKKAESLQSEFNSFRGDIAFMTQPVIRGHRGSEAFANRRNRIMDRYNKGFEEYRKSEYYNDKAQAAEETVNMSKFKDRVYLSNRIKECNKNIKTYEKNIVWCEENNKPENIEKWLDKMEYEMDKLAYMENCLDELGGTFSKGNIKEGYLIKARHGWMKVKKVNLKTVYAEFIENNGLLGMTSKVEYAEIKEIKVPEGFKEEKEELLNPYKVNDILVHYSISGNRVIAAYQIIKTTAKGVQLQEIHVENNKPIKDSFTNKKPMRKGIVKSKFSDFVGCYDGDWQLHLYKENEQITA